jgi:hypothetical protein
MNSAISASPTPLLPEALGHDDPDATHSGTHLRSRPSPAEAPTARLLPDYEE